MSHTPDWFRTRRRFLKMLGASPLIAGSSMLAGGLADLLRAEPLEEKHFLVWLESLQQQSDSVISSPDQALDVMDFEPRREKTFLRRIGDTSPPEWTMTQPFERITKAILGFKFARDDWWTSRTSTCHARFLALSGRRPLCFLPWEAKKRSIQMANWAWPERREPKAI